VKRWIVLAALLLAGTAALFFLQRSGATAPVTPRPLLYLVADTEREAERIPLALTRVSDSEEVNVGNQIATENGLLEQQPANGDRAGITAYLNKVGVAVSSHVQRKNIPYNFHFLDDENFVNAYALPGGHIVVGRGLLELLESEDELAAILGHEITHVDNRHAIERLQYELASRKLGLEDIYSLGSPFVDIFKAGYTKDQELEADRVGLDLAVEAGYSPAGGINVMKRFEELESREAGGSQSPVEEIAKVPFSALEEYFRSHPPASERRAALEREISARNWNESIPVRPLSIRNIFLADSAEKLSRSGNFSKSVAQFQEALRLDSTYVRAWRELAEAYWRSGNAGETARAAREAILRGETSRDWILLARALAVTSPKDGVGRLVSVGKEERHLRESNSYVTERTELAGFKFFAGNKDAMDDFQSALSVTQGAADQAEIRREMAWWMYRAGKLQDAAEQLESARQLYPGSAPTSLLQVWVFSDLGRQADATEALAARPSGQSELAEQQASRAVVAWRTDYKDIAKTLFQQAAQGDPVWMVPQWVRNNFSASAAGILLQLQGFESARRMKEIREHQQAPATQ
jgi:beta-barrel assembly-enhancing protease